MIARGAFLHDIGKISTPDEVLLKPGRLDAREMAIMREHCERGYEMVRKIPFLKDASEIVYAHQESFDGSGYPRGLAGNDIPLGARIFPPSRIRWTRLPRTGPIARDAASSKLGRRSYAVPESSLTRRL